MTVALLPGSRIFAGTAVIQVLAIVALVSFLRRRDRLGKFGEGVWVGTTALSGGLGE